MSRLHRALCALDLHHWQPQPPNNQFVTDECVVCGRTRFAFTNVANNHTFYTYSWNWQHWIRAAARKRGPG